MKLTTKTRYGLRFMIYLGLKHKQGPIHLKEVARSEQISDKYLEAIAASLKSAHLIESVRGNQGGYYLAGSPEDMTVFDVVSVFEGASSLIDSFSDTNAGTPEKNCVTASVWQGLEARMKEYLSSITLEDLVTRKKEKCEGGLYYI